MKQETFDKKKPTLLTELGGLTTPMGYSNTVDIYNEKNSGLLLKIIGSGLNLVGFNKNVYTASTDWGQNTSKELLAFQEKVGDAKFKEANALFNTQVADWLTTVKANPTFEKLSDENKQKVITNKKNSIKDSLFRTYGFRYKPERSPRLPRL